MKRALSMLLAFSMLISISANGFKLLAQQSNAGQKNDPAIPDDPFQPGHGFKHKLPASARIGSTPERKAAWDKLTQEEKDQARQKLNEIIVKARQKAEQTKVQDDDEDSPSATIAFTDKDGKRQLRTAMKVKKGSPKLLSMLTLKRSGKQFAAAATNSANGRVMFVKAGYREPIARHYAPRAVQQPGTFSTGTAECEKSVDQFVRDFYQGALARQPNGGELSNWVSTLTQAQAQGQSQLFSAAQGLGYALFQSQEYAARGRSDYDYVYDLYKAFLQREPDQGGWDFWANNVGQYGRDGALGAFGTSDEFQYHVGRLCAAGGVDADGDGLPDDFESRVADAFTPLYHVSAHETDQFATFNNTVPSTVTQLSIKQLFGQSPVSHFRVTPQGFSHNASGQLVSVLRVDYLTIWNHDGGLLSGALCAYNLFGLDELIQELNAHNIDQERSALLIAAPVSDYNYSFDPGAYSTYNVYTAAHEFKRIGDQSRYLDLYNSPVPAYYHVNLTLSLSKHGTYTFNPDYLPLTPWYIIVEAYEDIDRLYYSGLIGDYGYYQLTFLADDLFFSCIVERFFDQGGQFAGTRINVGEPNNPINNSAFIRVPEINKQLTTPFFRW